MSISKSWLLWLPPSEEIITKNEEYEDLGSKEVRETVISPSLEAFMFLDVLCLYNISEFKKCFFVFFNSDNIPVNTYYWYHFTDGSTKALKLYLTQEGRD